MLIRKMVSSTGMLTQRLHSSVKACTPAVNVLSVCFIFDSNLCNAKFLSIFD